MNIDLPNTDTDTLRVVLDETMQLIAIADEEKDVVNGHDLRCLADQVTAELERRPDDAET